VLGLGRVSRSLKVTVVGRDERFRLEASYARAFGSLGCDVAFYDLDAELARHTRLGRAGRLFGSFVPVEPWARKANRTFYLHVYERVPTLVLVSAHAPVRAGTLVQIKSARPQTKVVLLWPDPFIALEPHILAALPMYDMVATYSRTSMEHLRKLGARPIWLPFAADPELHPGEGTISEDDRRRYACDVLFIGNHRPEREKALLALVDAGLHVKVYGTSQWRRDARDRSRLDQYFQDAVLFGADFAAASRVGRVSLNVIDPGNFPAANMRFFESFSCGAATVNSSCPEMSEEFPEGVATSYFEDELEMLARIRHLLSDASMRDAIAAEGARRVRTKHTYRHRALELLEALELSP
jgi:spore maturation protein CgeB